MCVIGPSGHPRLGFEITRDASWCLPPRFCLGCTPPRQPPGVRRWGAESRARTGYRPVKDDPHRCARFWRLESCTQGRDHQGCRARSPRASERLSPTTRSPGSGWRHLRASRRPRCLGRSHWSGQLSHLVAGRLRACGRLVLDGRPRGGQLGCSTQTERVRGVSIGMAGISFVVSLGRGGKSFALSAGPKVLSHTIPSKARWAINGRRSRDQGAPGGRLKRSAWNGTEGSGRKRRPADAQAETLGSAGPGFPKGGLPAFHVEPNGPGWAVALRLGSAERGRMMLTVLLCAASSARRLRFLRGWRGSAGTTARERLRRQRLYFLAGLDRSFRIGNSEWIFGVDRATWESLRVVVPSGHPGLGFGDGCPCADPCSEGSHDPPVSVGEMRTHDPH